MSADFLFVVNIRTIHFIVRIELKHAILYHWPMQLPKLYEYSDNYPGITLLSRLSEYLCYCVRNTHNSICFLIFCKWPLLCGFCTQFIPLSDYQKTYLIVRIPGTTEGIYRIRHVVRKMENMGIIV